MLIEEATVGETAAQPRWHKFLFGGFFLCIGFFGLINLASVVASHGYEWHGAIADLIHGYRSTIFPIYDFLLLPLRVYFHITLTQPWKDLATCLLLSLAAANTESFIRDKRALIKTLLEIVAAARRHKKGDEKIRGPIERGNFITRAVPGFVYFLSAIFALVFSVTAGAQIWIFTFFPNSRIGLAILEHLPHWIFLWLRYWWVSAILSVIIGRGILPDATGDRSFSNWQMAWILPVFGLVMLLWAPIGAIILVALTFASFLVLLVASTVAPVIAWRTVATTVSLFSILLGANWLISHRII